MVISTLVANFGQSELVAVMERFSMLSQELEWRLSELETIEYQLDVSIAAQSIFFSVSRL